MAALSSSGWLIVMQVFQALLTPTIALGATWIALQQVKINRNKLKLDRFERRLKIYHAAVEYVSNMSIGASQEATQFTKEFLHEIRGAQFILSQEIGDYLNEIYRKATLLASDNRTLERESAPQEQREKAINRSLATHEWLTGQLEELRTRFTPYLAVEDL